MSKKYLIIGAGIAGMTAAETIRKYDQDGVITMVTGEQNLPYSRPMLTKSPFVSFDPGNWTIKEAAWFTEQNIDFHPATWITAVDKEKGTAEALTFGKGIAGKDEPSEKGTPISFAFDELILATGATNFVPPFEGHKKPGVMTIRQAEDIYAIKEKCLPGGRAVIIGGGVIGIEAALELLRYDVTPVILEAMPSLMMRQIDEELSDGIIKILEDRVTIETGVEIAAIGGDEKAESVILSDGRVYPCDFVIVACGVRANVDIANELGLTVDRAIVIDDHCRTSEPHIYACGDCAQFSGINYALWTQGQLQGEVAGANAAGREAFFEKVDSTLVITGPELSLCAIGDLGKQEGAAYEVKYERREADETTFFTNPRHGQFFEKQYYLDGRLVGVGILGNLSNMQDRKEKILGATEVTYVE